MRLILLLGVFVAGKLMAAVPGSMEFELRDPKTKEVYFTGSEKVTVEGKAVHRETSYFDKAKKEVQKETYTFDNDSLKTSSFSSGNTLTGEEVSVTPKDKGYEIVYKAAQGKPATSTLAPLNALLANSAADLIVANWDKLVAGKALRFPLVVPSRGEALPFQLVRRESATIDGEAREVFTLMPQNLLLKTLAPHLEFQFTKEKKLRAAFFPTSLPIKGTRDKMVELVVKK